MKAFDKCPVCSGNLEHREVEKLLRGGSNLIAVKVYADVCLHCGEQLHSDDVVQSFEEIRTKLRNQEFSHLKNLGQAFTVSEDWPNKAIRPAF